MSFTLFPTEEENRETAAKVASYPGHTQPQFSAIVGDALSGESTLFLARQGRQNDLVGFATSVYSSAVPEFFGARPSRDVQRFRDRNPWAGFASELVGGTLPLLVPFAGQGAVGLRLASQIPKLNRLTQVAATTMASPFKRGFAREVARFAPLEAGRLGIAGTFGEEGDFGRAAAGAANNLLIGGGLGGGASYFASLRASRGPAQRTEDNSIRRTIELLSKDLGPNVRIDGLDAMSNPQDMLKALRRIKSDRPFPTDTHMQANLQKGIDDLETLIRTQDGKTLLQGLDSQPEVTVRPLGTNAGELLSGSAGNWNAVAPAPGNDGALSLFRRELGRTFEDAVQFPRELIPTGPQGRAKLQANMLTNLRKVQDDTWMGRENETGLYMMVKRVKSGRIQKIGSATVQEPDRFLAFKTHDPKRFAKKSDVAFEAVIRSYSEIPDFAASELDEATLPFLRDAVFNEETIGTHAGAKIPISLILGRNQGFIKRGSSKAIQASINKVFDDATAHNLRESARLGSENLGRWLTDTSKALITPTTTLFGDNALAATMWNSVKNSVDLANGRAREALYGRVVADATRTPASSIFAGRTREGGLIPGLQEAIDTSDMAGSWIQMQRAFLLRASGATDDALVDAGLSGDVIEQSKNVMDHLEHMATLTKSQNETLGLIPVSGASTRAQLEQHFVSLSFRGNARVPLLDAQDRIIGYATGPSRKSAVEEAEFIVQEMNKTVPGRVKLDRPDTTFDLIPDQRSLGKDFPDIHSDMDRIQLLEVDPGDPIVREIVEKKLDFIEGSGARGVFGRRQTGQALWKELTKTLEGNTYGTYRRLANDAIENTQQHARVALQQQDDKTFRRFNDRFQTLTGDRTDFSKKVDRIVDERLEPLFGKGAAAEAVRKVNRAMHTLTLGAGDVGYGVLNVLTPIQTAMPELSFVLGAVPDRLKGFYSAAVVDAMTAGRRPVSVLDPVKMMKRAFQDMFSKSDEVAGWLKRGRESEVISQTFIEQTTANEGTIGRISSLLSGRGSITDALLEVSEFIPSRSEEFSRATTYVLGRRVAKDLFNMSDDVAHSFASQLTLKSQFGYGQGDRAQMFTGALGSGFGLFKTWVTSYMNNLVRYGADAVHRKQFGPLVYSLATSGAIGGVGAMPAFGLVNWASRQLTDDNFNTNLYEVMGGEEGTLTSDMVAYGLPSVLGLSLQGRAAAPTADPLRDIGFATSFATYDRAKALGQLAGQSLDSWARTGESPFKNPSVRDAFVRAFAPRTLQKTIQSWSGDVRSLRNQNTLVEGLGRIKQAAHVFGFTPLEVEKAFDIRDELQADQDSKRASITFTGDAMAFAQANGDWDEWSRLLNSGILRGLPADSLIERSFTKTRNMDEAALDRQYDLLNVQAARRARGVTP